MTDRLDDDPFSHAWKELNLEEEAAGFRRLGQTLSDWPTSGGAIGEAVEAFLRDGITGLGGKFEVLGIGRHIGLKNRLRQYAPYARLTEEERRDRKENDIHFRKWFSV